MITTYRLIWSRPSAVHSQQNCLTLPLSYIIYIEEEGSSSFSFRKSRKIILHLTEPSLSTQSHKLFSLFIT